MPTMPAQTSLVPRLPLRPDPVETGRMWMHFVQTRDNAAREQLVAAYMGFARMMAAKVYSRRSYTEMEFADYLQYATVGLLEALDRFEPDRGVLFESFAARRITGAVLNGIASSSEIQRQIAARKQMIGLRVASLNELASMPAGAEALFARLAELAIGLAVGFALEESGMYAREEGAYADNTYAGVELKQLKGRVRAALGALAPNQRRVLEAHYLQQMSFEDVATSMALTRGRISQIHKEALQNLRGLLKASNQIDLDC
jgi:RNA polymerase sigma factor for flagellar operon FliA